MRIKAFLLVMLLALPGGVSRGEEGKAAAGSQWAIPPVLKPLVGEKLKYDLSFLWFKRLAVGTVSFTRGEEPGTYRAILDAKTRGLAALFTRDRAQRHESLMTLGDDGLLHSLSYEVSVLRGSGASQRAKTKTYQFDYKSKVVHYQRRDKGKVTQEKVLSLPTDIVVFDPMAAFFNFRFGLFGDIERGTRKAIHTFDRKGTSDIVVEVLSKEEHKKHPRFPSNGYLCRIQLDREILDTGGGVVYLWLDEALRPALGVVENVIGMGDVRGTLRN